MRLCLAKRVSQLPTDHVVFFLFPTHYRDLERQIFHDVERTEQRSGAAVGDSKR